MATNDLYHKQLTGSHSAYFAGWRGAAALAVFISHAAMIFVLPVIPKATLQSNLAEIVIVACGSSSVAVFFVLSGLFIRLSIERNSWEGRFDVKRYVKSGMNRILPPFFVAILLSISVVLIAPFLFQTGTGEFESVAVGALAHSGVNIKLIDLLATLLFVSSFWGQTIDVNSPLWSLSYEVWLYVWAACYGLIKSSRLKTFNLRSLFCFTSVLGFALVRPHFGFMAMIWMTGFLIGDVWLRGFNWSTDILSRIKNIWFCTSLIVGAGVVACVLWGFIGARFGGMIIEWLVGVFAALLFLTTMVGSNPNVHYAAASVSGYSYSLYVFHMPIMLLGFGLIAAGRHFEIAQLGESLIVIVVAFLFSKVLGSRLERWKAIK
jgi:peptidoglycan/LPS O-acetylase OafA/YrhL